ncbi:mevalonate kinase [Candidatus Woesearchaeota archaeon]|nr:mevalonate kinase [Candidatus Woesearchaeota archaeon]
MSVACSKIILFGEHSVVYGKPAIAIPLKSLFTEVRIENSENIEINSDYELNINEQNNLKNIINLILNYLDIKNKNISVNINSNIPVASGMGSSASLSVALAKSVSDYFHKELSPEEISMTAYKCEKIFHGMPSGIDNTVIAYEKPVYFVKGKKTETVKIGKPFTLLIADTGIVSSTKEIVLDVKKEYEKNKGLYEKYFNGMADIAEQARIAIKEGNIKLIGKLMTENHRVLQKIKVSSSELDNLVETALTNGASGAKLVGAGRGGNIAVLAENNKNKIRNELLKAGAADVIEELIE